MIIPTLAAAEKWVNRAKATLDAGVCANSSGSGPGLVSLRHWWATGRPYGTADAISGDLVLASLVPTPTYSCDTHKLASQERE